MENITREEALKLLNALDRLDNLKKLVEDARRQAAHAENQ